MIALVRIALRRPYTFVVLALVILIVGPLAALRTPVDIFPDIRIPVVAIVWQYTGLPPADMAGRITTQSERALTTTVNDIEHIEASSYNGIGIIKVYFQSGADIRLANAQITAISQTQLKQMPAGATPPLILNYSASTVPIIQLALSGSGLSEQTLADLGLNTVRTPLVTVPGAAIPLPYGGKLREVQIDLNSAAMQARNLSGQDVANALAAQNLITPVGTEKIGSSEYTINLNDAPSRIVELGDLPIKSVNGAMVYIHDVAQVRDGNPPQTNIVHVNGNRSVLMQVLKNGSVSTLAIVDGIKAKLQQIKDILPSNLQIAQIGDQSIFIKAAISGVVREGIIAAALTSLMILVFLGSWRSTLIIATSIPLSVLGSIATLAALGQTLNIMTLGGLALAVGILVDDATVTIENINYHLEQGKEVETAILDGAAQIVTPAFVSLLCICIVFVPMFFFPGVARFLFVPMAEAVMSAMVCSFILSRTLVPTMANYLLRPTLPTPTSTVSTARCRRRAIRWSACSAASRPASSVFARLIASCCRWRCARRGAFVDLLSRGVRGRVVRADALSRPRLFSVGRRRPDFDACAHPRRHPHRGHRRPIRRHRKGHSPDHSHRSDRHVGGQHRFSGERHQHDLQQQRYHRQPGRRHSDKADRRPPPHDRLCTAVTRGTAGTLSRSDVFIPARRHHQPDSQFRRAGADRSAGTRAGPERRFELCANNCCGRCTTFRAWWTHVSNSRWTARLSTSTSTARAPSISA